METSLRRVKEYIAGASLAFGIVLLTLQLLGVYYEFIGLGWEEMTGYDAGWLLILFVVIHILGGLVGGYLVSRRREMESFRPGVITAVIAYIIEYIYQLLFEGFFPGSLWALICYVGGGVFGSIAAEAKSVGSWRRSVRG